MKKVTGQQKCDVLILAEEIVKLCRKHTTNDHHAVTATQIAKEVILAAQLQVAQK